MEPHQIDQTVRLGKLIKALNVNQITFARRLGTAQSNISKIVSGKGQVSIEVLNRISSVYKQVNLHWLLTGEGEMFFEETAHQGQDEKKPPTTVVVEKAALEKIETDLERLKDAVSQIIKSH